MLSIAFIILSIILLNEYDIYISGQVYPDANLETLSGGCQFKIEDLLQQPYDKTRPPTQNGNPAIVSISLTIIDIPKIKNDEFVIDMDVLFRQQWTDRRLKIPATCPSSEVILDNKWNNDIWFPDTVFSNSRDGNLFNIVIPYSYVILSNNSQLIMTSRLSLLLHCSLDLRSYPHDTQTCDVEMTSLRHHAESVELRWTNFNVGNIVLPQFYVTGTEMMTFKRRTIVGNKIGKLSILRGVVQLHRRQGFYLLNYFIPSFLIVLTSFATFSIPLTAYSARVALTLTPLLTIVTQYYRGNTIPAVSYIMAITIWSSGCIIFVFSTLVEYAILIALYQRNLNRKRNNATDNHNQEKPISAKAGPQESAEEFVESRLMNESNVPVAQRKTIRSRLSNFDWRKLKTELLKVHVDSSDEYHNTLDVRSRILFPALYCFFVVVYFSVYAQR